jgi:endonuclease/exonuclease/phosphatase family metal-dependent hydrolase
VVIARSISLLAAAFGLVFSGLTAATLAPAQATPVQFSIGSFNVKDPDRTGCGPWTSRGPLVAKNIIDRKLNVVGVQEVFERSDREELIKYVNYAASGQWSLTYPYAMTFPPEKSSVSSSDFPYSGYDDRILYDTRKVSLKGTWAMRFRNQDPLDNKYGRHAVWALFTHVTNGRPFLVFNTHLAPGNDTYDELQWKELLAQIQAFRSRYTAAYNGTFIPVFAIGDYNTTKFEAAAKDMLPAMRNAGVGDILGQQYRSYTTSAARVVSGSGNAYINSFNDCNPDTRQYRVASDRNGNSPDYIFASNSLKGPSGPIPFNEVVNFGTYPFLRSPIPSDHFLVTATVVLP